MTINGISRVVLAGALLAGTGCDRTGNRKPAGGTATPPPSAATTNAGAPAAPVVEAPSADSFSIVEALAVLSDRRADSKVRIAATRRLGAVGSRGADDARVLAALVQQSFCDVADERLAARNALTDITGPDLAARMLAAYKRDDWLALGGAAIAREEAAADHSAPDLSAGSRDFKGADSEERDISTLLDPHAGSSQKMGAVRRLAEHAPRIRTATSYRIYSALARQALYDMAPVREAATEALVRLVGKKESARMIAEYRPMEIQPFDSEFATDWLEATRDWPAAQRFGADLRSVQREDRLRAVVGLSKLAAADPKPLASLDNRHQGRLVVHLDEFDRAQPAARADVLRLVEILGADRAAGVWLTLRGLADDDAQTRKLAGRVAGVALKRLAERPDLLAALTRGLLDPNPKVAEAASALVTPEVAKPLTPHLSTALADAAIRGDFDAIHLLKDFKMGTRDFTEAVYARYESGRPGDVLHLLEAMRLADAGADLDDATKFRDVLLAQLVSGERGGDRADEFRVAAARVITTPNSRAAAAEHLAAAVGRGVTLSPAMLAALKPDAEELGRLLVEPLSKGSPEARRAAVLALGEVGASGDAIRALLAPLVRDRSDTIRFAAARALNTPEALALARVPDVLKDSRSDDPFIRQRAARSLQFLGVEPAAISDALVRAVDRRDMPAREGLLAAIEQAYATQAPVVDVLKQTAGDEAQPAAPRAFARAALHELGSGGKPGKE